MLSSHGRDLTGSEYDSVRILVNGFGGLGVSVLAFGTQDSRSRRIFRAKKSSARLPSEGKKSRRSHVVNLWHVKEPKSDVEVATFGKILGHFSPIVQPSAAGVRSLRFRREGHLVAGVGSSNHWSFKLGL